MHELSDRSFCIAVSVASALGIALPPPQPGSALAPSARLAAAHRQCHCCTCAENVARRYGAVAPQLS